MATQRFPRCRAPHTGARTLALLLLLLGLSAGFLINAAPERARAAAFSTGDTVVVNTDRLNLRAEPSIDATVIHVFEQGNVMKVTGDPVTADGHDWYPIDAWYHGPTYGWVAGEFLLLMTDSYNDGSSGYEPNAYVYVTTDTLNVRSGPGLGYPVIRQFLQDQRILIQDGPVVADGYHWYGFASADQPTMGWFAGEFVALVDESGGDDGSDDGWDPPIVVGGVAVVEAPRLNCRTGPGLSYPVDHVMIAGESFLVLDGPVHTDGFHWYELSMAGGVAWAIGEGLAPAGGSPDPGDGSAFPKGAEVIVNTDRLNLRVGAGIAQSVIMTLPYGTALIVSNGPVSADGYSWYEVETRNGDLGWVAGAFLAYASGDGGDDGGWVPIFEIGSTATVDTDRLNCRTGPGLSYGVSHVLSGGGEVTILDGPVAADGYHWYQVETASGVIGWSIGEGLI